MKLLLSKMVGELDYQMIKFFEVGGCVRDELMGVKSKDIDFAVEAPSFEAMRQAILDRGGKIFLESPEFFTIRARDKKLGPVDFVLCRKDGVYKDGRHPESVEIGTLRDDLSRRDFTMNAIAKDEDGNFIDPFNGQADIKNRIIRCVGNAEDRFGEDALRIIRAIRFSITKNMAMDHDIVACLMKSQIVMQLRAVSTERIREELLKCFAHDTFETLVVLNNEFPMIRSACFGGGFHKLKLMPTLKQL